MVKRVKHGKTKFSLVRNSGIIARHAYLMVNIIRKKLKSWMKSEKNQHYMYKPIESYDFISVEDTTGKCRSVCTSATTAAK
jgi:hypothetical protein